ncbi:MAG TPA: FHA domain-containing protein [Gammaproteobacteria bacterium]
MSNEGTFVIGRHKDADIVIDDATVGRRHAELVVTNGKFFLADLDSSNGIFQLLPDGREIRFSRGWVSATDRFAFGRFESSVAELLGMLPQARLQSLGILGQIRSILGHGPEAGSVAGPVVVGVVRSPEQTGRRVRCLNCGHVYLASEPQCPKCSTPRKV